MKNIFSAFATLLLVLSAMVSCEKSDNYITIDNLAVQVGYIKGSIVGISSDSIIVNEKVDLRYSDIVSNTISLKNDSNSYFTISSLTDPYHQKYYSCNTRFTINQENGSTQLDQFYLSLTKKLNSSQILEIYFNDITHLTIENFAYDAQSQTVSGHISGNTGSKLYYTYDDDYNSSTYQIDLEFKLKVLVL